FDECGAELIRYSPHPPGNAVELPEPATEPEPPPAICNNEELYLTGLHLEQYRHATRSPQPYWREALRRDAEDARCNNALGLLALRQVSFSEAAEHFEAAIRRLTRRNPNPRDGEPFYNLGLTRIFQGRTEEAYAAFYKAIWNYAWQSAGFYELAAIDCLCARFDSALAHLERSLQAGADHLKARNLKTAVLRHQQKREVARHIATETI